MCSCALNGPLLLELYHRLLTWSAVELHSMMGAFQVYRKPKNHRYIDLQLCLSQLHRYSLKINNYMLHDSKGQLNLAVISKRTEETGTFL